jgi:rhamnulokinase
MSGPDRRVFGAVDIGASGGRVMVGLVGPDGVRLEPVHRFDNGAREIDGHLRWDVRRLYEEVLHGLTELGRRYPEVTSIGIDTWAVDYGLLDDAGDLIELPIAYRDDRTGPVVDRVHARVEPAELYAITGLQFLPFNTIYQLAAEQGSARRPRIAQVLLLPDLLGWWLTGQRRTEITNASTTGLLDARTRDWSTELLDRCGIPADWWAPLIEPGETLGPLRPEIARRTGLAEQVRVVAVGSHDTASAVVAVPAVGTDFAYVSSGTWSLVGQELPDPVLTEASREANFTNEGGVDGRVRYLRNVGGLWLLQESLRTWRERGEPHGLDELLTAAAALPAGGPTVDVDAAEFLAPGDLPARIRSFCADRGRAVPGSSAELVRCILDSLALAYASTVATAQQLSGNRVDVIHVVGGGSQNALLCRLTADAAGLPVLAGPVEATALGNVLVQGRALGALSGSLEDLRVLVARTHPPVVHQPNARGAVL